MLPNRRRTRVSRANSASKAVSTFPTDIASVIVLIPRFLQESASPAPPSLPAVARTKTFTVTRGMTGSLPSSDAPSSSKRRKHNYSEESDDISVASLEDRKDDPGDRSYQPSEASNEPMESNAAAPFRAPAPPIQVRAISAPGPIPPPLPTATMPVAESPFYNIQDAAFPIHHEVPQMHPSHHMTHGRRHTVADLSSIAISFGAPNYGYVSWTSANLRSREANSCFPSAALWARSCRAQYRRRIQRRKSWFVAPRVRRAIHDIGRRTSSY